MPVSCSVSIAKLSTAELRELDYRVMRHAFDSQNELGRLADERIYQADLAARLRSAGMTVSREVEVQLLHCEISSLACFATGGHRSPCRFIKKQSCHYLAELKLSKRCCQSIETAFFLAHSVSIWPRPIPHSK